jgi:hypothetical protein
VTSARFKQTFLKVNPTVREFPDLLLSEFTIRKYSRRREGLQMKAYLRLGIAGLGKIFDFGECQVWSKPSARRGPTPDGRCPKLVAT